MPGIGTGLKQEPHFSPHPGSSFYPPCEVAGISRVRSKGFSLSDF